MNTALHTGDIVRIKNMRQLKNGIKNQTGTVLKWSPYIDMYTVLINGETFGLFNYEMDKIYPHYSEE
jgi:hypothetical protein